MGTISKRETALMHPEKASQSMALPEGLYCKDCISFKRCQAFIGLDEMNEVCDFYPNRFKKVEVKNVEITAEEGQAYEWAIRQPYHSVAADAARTLAKLLNRTGIMR